MCTVYYSILGLLMSKGEEVNRPSNEENLYFKSNPLQYKLKNKQSKP